MIEQWRKAHNAEAIKIKARERATRSVSNAGHVSGPIVVRKEKNDGNYFTILLVFLLIRALPTPTGAEILRCWVNARAEDYPGEG